MRDPYMATCNWGKVNGVQSTRVTRPGGGQGQVVFFAQMEVQTIKRDRTRDVAHLLPKLFPQPSQLHEKGFSLVCVLSCLWTCSTRLHEEKDPRVSRSQQYRGGDLSAYLNHLLQYLHGNVFGFCCFISPASSARGGLGPSTDWMESIFGQQAWAMPPRLGYRNVWDVCGTK